MSPSLLKMIILYPFWRTIHCSVSRSYTTYPFSRLTKSLLTELEDDSWSDSDADASPDSNPAARIRALEKQLQLERRKLADYRALVLKQSPASDALKDIDGVPAQVRDDDSHYFSSYDENSAFTFTFSP